MPSSACAADADTAKFVPGSRQREICFEAEILQEFASRKHRTAFALDGLPLLRCLLSYKS